MLSIKNLSKSFGNEKVIDSLSFELNEGECLAVVGKSGRGKSTLLNILSGHDSDFQGTISGRVSLEPSLDKAYIYQGVEQLFPWMTVKENIKYPMIQKGFADDRINGSLALLLNETDLENHGNKYPKALSGGMKQRAILARAIGFEPKLVLLDEPFSHLDDMIKERLQDLLVTLKNKHQLTMVFVTHDLHEAIKISDRILIMGENFEIIEAKDKNQDHEAYWTIYKKLSRAMRKEQL